VTASDIRACFREYYQYRFAEVGLFEFGISYDGDYFGCIFDAFIIVPHRQFFKGFEFKVSRSDFLSDQKRKNKYYGPDVPKWRRYLKYCHLFYWVTPEGLVKPEEVETPAGLIWICPLERGGFGFRVMKRPRRTTPSMDPKLIQRILFFFAARAKTRSGRYF
jgi:hypothetical protein